MIAGMNDEQIGRMSKTLFRFCLSRTGSYHDAEDLAQEVLLTACRAGNHFESEKAFYAFVWKTAGNILKSWYRRQNGRRTEQLDEEMPDHRYDEMEEHIRDQEQLGRISGYFTGFRGSLPITGALPWHIMLTVSPSVRSPGAFPCLKAW